MGERGPRPLPKNVLKFRGASHLKKDALGSVVEPDIEIPNLPTYLQPDAKRFWKRLAPELEKLGLIALIDEAMATVVVSEYAWFVHFDRLFKRDSDAAQLARKAHEKAEAAKRKAARERNELYIPEPWTRGDGVQIETKAGNLTYNPNWVARNKHAMQLDRVLAAFGMSPSSRGRVSASTRQIELPGMETTPKEGFAAM